MKLILQIAAGVALGLLATTAILATLVIATAPTETEIVAEFQKSMVQLEQAPLLRAYRDSARAIPAPPPAAPRAVETPRRQKGTYEITTESGKRYSSDAPLEEFIRLEPTPQPAPPPKAR